LSRLALAIAVKGEWDAEQLAEQLRTAGVPAEAEVHMACDPEFALAESSSSLFVHTRDDASLFQLWAVAIQATRSPWVAVLHGFGLPGPGWFSAMEREIEGEGWKDGYWGPVEPGPSISRGGMVGYLTEYCQFHRPVEPGLREIPGSNLVLPRERIGKSEDFSKTRLLQEGLAPKYVEAAVVNYARPFALGDYCRRRFRHGRAYAAERLPRLSLFRAIPLSLALPFVRTVRIMRHAWRHPELRSASILCLPAILLAETCWSMGELGGYVTRRPGILTALD
jgi:hypothetical protein